MKKPTRASRIVVPIILFVVAAALVVTGSLLLANPKAKDTSDNTALLSGSATSQVIGQVSTGLNEVLSYDYDNPDPAKAAAAKWLTGDAVGQYKLLFQQLNERAPDQKLSFVAKVVTAGVTSLEGDTAQLLVFLDQQATRASDGASSTSAAQVLIQAHLDSGTWRITELNPL